MDSSRFLLNKADTDARARVNTPVYRIGNKDPITGLYETLGMDGSVVGYGIKIFNNTYEYGDVVRATKPYGSNVWALDKIDKIAKKESLNPSPSPSPSPPPTPPPSPPPNNGFGTVPPTTTPNGGGRGSSGGGQNPNRPPNCPQPLKGCRWQDASIPCNGNIQDFDYVKLNTGSRVLCCDPSVNAPPDGGCTAFGYACSNGVCRPTRGAGQTLAQCQASLIPPPYTGGQGFNVIYNVVFKTEGIRTPNPLSDGIRTHARSFRGAVDIRSLVEAGETDDPALGNFSRYAVEVFHNDGDGLRVSTVIRAFNQWTFYNATLTFFDVDITRVDGEPDNDGDPPYKCP